MKPGEIARTRTHPLAWKPAHAFRRQLTHLKKATLQGKLKNAITQSVYQLPYMSSNNSPWNPCGTCWLAPQKIAPETPVNTRVKPSTPRKRLREQRVYAYQRGLPDMLSTCSRKGYGFSCAGQACVNSPPARGPDSNPSKHQIWPKACKTHSPLHRHPLPTCSSTPLHSHSKSKAAPCAEPRPWADHSGKAMTMPGETWATASCCVMSCLVARFLYRLRLFHRLILHHGRVSNSNSQGHGQTIVGRR